MHRSTFAACPQSSLGSYLSALGVVIFLYVVWQAFSKKRVAADNPWGEGATTLEWTIDGVPGHGNFGPELPTVHRWPFDYGLPGAEEDFVPQTTPLSGSGTGS